MVPIAEQKMLTFENSTAEIETANEQGRVEVETAKEGPGFTYFYHEFSVEFPLTISYQELTDEEVLTLAEKAGTFDFLNAPDEDIYNPSDGTPI